MVVVCAASEVDTSMTTSQKMVLSYMMLNINSAFDYIYSQDDTISLIYYTGDQSNTIIPVSRSGVRIKDIEPSCFNSNQSVEHITISDGIVNIY